MSEEQRLLIVKLELRKDGNVDLFARGHKFRDTTLFAASDLLEVGIDPATLETGVETPCRFYAHVVTSEKCTSKGNPYLDVQYLEPVVIGNGHQAQPAGDAGEAVLKELQLVNRNLARLIALLSKSVRQPASVGEGTEPPDLPELDVDDDPVLQPDDALLGQAPAPGPQPLSDDQARRMFSSIAGPAIREGTVTSGQVNEITGAVVAIGWRDALEALQALIESEPEAE